MILIIADKYTLYGGWRLLFSCMLHKTFMVNIVSYIRTASFKWHFSLSFFYVLLCKLNFYNYLCIVHYHAIYLHISRILSFFFHYTNNLLTAHLKSYSTIHTLKAQISETDGKWRRQVHLTTSIFVCEVYTITTRKVDWRLFIIDIEFNLLYMFIWLSFKEGILS